MNDIVFCQNCGLETADEFCKGCGKSVYLQPISPMQTQSYTLTRSPHHARNTAKLITIMLSAILILAGILSFFLISRESGHGVPEGLVVDMTATDTMKVNINGDYIQNNSYTLRELIDEDFGDGDGFVSTEELREFEEQYEDYSGNPAYGFMIDGEVGKYTQCSLRLTHAEGNVTGDYPITFSFSATITWPYIDTQKYSYNIYIGQYDFAVGQFWFKSPPGYEIYRLDGLVDEICYGQKTASGTIDEDALGIHITIIEKVQGEDNGEGENEPNNSMETANRVYNEDLVRGNLNAYDDEVDYYYIIIRQGNVIEITLTGSGFSDFDLRLYNPDGYQVAHSTEDGSEEYIRHVSFSTGNHYIKVDTFSGSGDYVLTVKFD